MVSGQHRPDHRCLMIATAGPDAPPSHEAGNLASTTCGRAAYLLNGRVKPPSAVSRTLAGVSVRCGNRQAGAGPAGDLDIRPRPDGQCFWRGEVGLRGPAYKLGLIAGSIPVPATLSKSSRLRSDRPAKQPLLRHVGDQKAVGRNTPAAFSLVSVNHFVDVNEMIRPARLLRLDRSPHGRFRIPGIPRSAHQGRG
jgi:hypothetical protein